jgi:hypothetical protein
MSYRVIIRTLGQPKDITANVFFSTREEAREFGWCSVDVLEHYLPVDKWRVEESDQPANHVLLDGLLHPIPATSC